MKIINTLIIMFSIFQTGCDHFVEIQEPRTELAKKIVFSEASTAEAAVVDLYTALRDGFAGGARGSIAGIGALASDELDLYITSQEYQAINDNEIMPNNPLIESLWSDLYSTVYKTNAILEGLGTSSIGHSERDQFIGEALFIRAYAYFYLVNLWGDVPLTLTTDYRVNNEIPRVSAGGVYEQIISDLLNAEGLLPKGYSGDRVRANQGAATALLARVYLFLAEWEKAENAASRVIQDELYFLEDDLSLVFRKSSEEAILQLWNVQYPNQYPSFLISSLVGPLFATLRSEFLTSFAADDLRMSTWIVTKSALLTGSTHTGLNKYESNVSPPEDYSTILRLAEQYLIRAEARARQNNLPGAVSDIDAIRARAGLGGTTASTQEEIFEAIMLERKHELFSEEGLRWLDLKRTGKARDILLPLKTTWDEEDVLFPIPESQMISNPNIPQNPIGS